MDTRNPFQELLGKFDDKLNGLVDLAIKGFGRGAGLSVYMVSKKAAELMNQQCRKIKLTTETKKRLGAFYPNINLNEVVVIEQAKLPAGLFKDNIAGMTSGQYVYTTYKDCQTEYYGMLNLMHELVHVEQIKMIGENEFAKQYGQQFVNCGGYGEKMPFEGEAYGFVRNFPFEPFFYLRTNPDVDRDTQGSKSKAFIHWLDIGIDEGRQGCTSFNAQVYLSKNPDIEAICGKGNYRAAVGHWARKGKKEGKKGI